VSEQEKDQNEADVREEQDDAEVEAHMPARRGGGRNEEAPEQPDEIDQSDEDDEPDVEAHGGVRAF
jgi:hypothetical protein